MNMIKEGKLQKKDAGLAKKLASLREITLILIIAIFVVVMCFASEHFAKWSNIKVLLASLATSGITTIGMTIVLISGGIDLSVGSVMCMAMAFAGTLITVGINPWIASVVGVLSAAVCGLVMGLLVTKLKLSHFIVTLCFMGIARGIVYAMTSGTSISLVAMLREIPQFAFIGQGYIGGIFPMTFTIFIVIAVIAEIFARKSKLMRKVYYVGSNEQAAEHSGIKTDRVKIGACVACSTLAGVAAIIFMTKFSGVNTSAGVGLEMTALSAAVIGGVSMNGGKGSVSGALLGLFLIVLVQNAMTLFSVPAFWQDLIRYVIVLLAVILDVIQENHKIKLNS